ncbi:MAG TPA: heavy metal translocating P-type ATPase [Acidobacteriaceae bacterium]|nr:heavy metal translocating P-type ATPase [Acidobacteriaceae bacterium]
MNSTPAQERQEQQEQQEFSLHIAGMSCAACQSHVQRALSAVPGVKDASVDLLAHVAHITATANVAQEALKGAVRQAGYDVRTPSGSSDAAPSATATDISEPGQGSLGLRAALALTAGALAMLLSMPLMASDPTKTTDPVSQALMHLSMAFLPASLLPTSPQLLRWILFLLALLTMLFAAPEIFRAAWRAAAHRTTNMNTLVALGTLVAFTASTYTTVSLTIGRPSKNFSDVYFEAVVLILAFLLAGRWLEARARKRATASLRAFAKIDTGNARWIGEGAPEDPAQLLHAPETLLPLDAVAVGDLLRVLPGDRIPLDGMVLAGRSSVDESMLTGEPLPVTREPGHRLFSGTLNLDGPLLFRATALGADSMQAQMARLLERARSTRAPLQRVADRVSGVFVPVVLAIAALTFTVWAVVDNTGAHALGYGRALSLAVAVLVVACPCAMGLAIPAAVAVSLGSAARAGILIKGGEALESLAAVDTILFDKTGTLTEGRPQIAAFALSPASPYSRNTLLRWALALETFSTHPLATAICSYARAQGTPAAESGISDVQVVPGIGVRGTAEGHEVLIGRAAYAPADAGEEQPPSTDGLANATPIFIQVDGQLAASLFAVDTLRSTAAEAVAQVKALGLGTGLLTGDTQAAADGIVAQLGIPTAYAGRLPQGKLDDIERLQREGHKVAMVGDGLNDASALARADAGIAVASGTDLAREAGHVLLLKPDLRLVPLSLRVARRTRRLMRQNLGWALLYNVLGIPIAAGVLVPRFGISLSPALASAAMALSSVSVLLNSLRLAHLPTLPPGSAPQVSDAAR